MYQIIIPGFVRWDQRLIQIPDFAFQIVWLIRKISRIYINRGNLYSCQPELVITRLTYGDMSWHSPHYPRTLEPWQQPRIPDHIRSPECVLDPELVVRITYPTPPKGHRVARSLYPLHPS
jgi:hypothetical protein